MTSHYGLQIHESSNFSTGQLLSCVFDPHNCHLKDCQELLSEFYKALNL